MVDRNWSLPQNPLEIREDGVVIDSDVGVVDFVGLQVTGISAGIVEVTDALFGGATAGLVHLKCVRSSGCEYIQSVVFVTDAQACTLHKVAC